MPHSAISVAKYLLDRANDQGRSISPMKLIKLVYMAHGWSLGLYGTPLIQEPVEAWKYGPVIRELYHKVKDYRSSPIPPGAFGSQRSDDEFSEIEKTVMDQTLEIYGKWSAIELSQLTHAEGTPWDVMYNKIGTSFAIPNDMIEDHYGKLYYESKERQGTNGGS